MAKSVRVTAVTKKGNEYQFTFGKRGYQFPDAQSIRNLADTVDEDDLLRRLAIAIWCRRNPNLDRPGDIEGKTITLDFASATPLTIS